MQITLDVATVIGALVAGLFCIIGALIVWLGSNLMRIINKMDKRMDSHSERLASQNSDIQTLGKIVAAHEARHDAIDGTLNRLQS